MPLIRVSDPVFEKLIARQNEMLEDKKRQVTMSEVVEVLLEKVEAP